VLLLCLPTNRFAPLFVCSKQEPHVLRAREQPRSSLRDRQSPAPLRFPFLLRCSCTQVLWLWLAIDPCTKLLPVLYLGPRTQHAAHRVIHSLRLLLAPGCVPLFTSDGLNLYFYALTAHFGQWLQVVRRGGNVRRWQVEPSLIYGQVKKSYRRRTLVRVTHVMRLGTEAALTVALQQLGFSGRLNTAYIERVNLTVRHGVAALARQ